MAVVMRNQEISPDIFHLVVGGISGGKCGQFYMLKPNDTLDPLLGRPISILDCDDEHNTTSFLYQVVGKGTDLLSRLRTGDYLAVTGPFGNGFPALDADVTLIGGGIGIAPLYYYAREQKRLFPNRKLNIHLGFREESYFTEEFQELADEFSVNIGGFVTDDVNFDRQAIYVTCGPGPMMQAVAKLCREHGKELYVSMEARMACGVGACLACTCKTAKGNKRVCKDGPVFKGEEIYE